MEIKIENNEPSLYPQENKCSLNDEKQIYKLSTNFNNMITVRNESNVYEDADNSSLQDNFKRFLKMRKVLFNQN